MKLRFATVCSSNMNRSMEAHRVLQEAGFSVGSYGTGTRVRLPGKDGDDNSFEFGTPYEEMLEVLVTEDLGAYSKSGIIKMLERNKNIKRAPQRWQDDHGARFDIVFAFEERVFDAIVEDLQARGGTDYERVHVINLETTDSAEEAAKAAVDAEKLAKLLERDSDIDNNIQDIVEDFEKTSGRPLSHIVMYY